MAARQRSGRLHVALNGRRAAGGGLGAVHIPFPNGPWLAFSSYKSLYYGGTICHGHYLPLTPYLTHLHTYALHTIAKEIVPLEYLLHTWR